MASDKKELSTEEKLEILTAKVESIFEYLDNGQVWPEGSRNDS
jgi:hypothetical protein